MIPTSKRLSCLRRFRIRRLFPLLASVLSPADVMLEDNCSDAGGTDDALTSALLRNLVHRRSGSVESILQQSK
jgi:hypothetical protein